jgi:hypothetical protein
MTTARQRLAALALVAAAAAAGCTEVNTAADHVAALQFDSLPAPAIVSGDSLRDSLGLAAPLRAIALNGAGNVVTDAAIQYIALDTGITIGAGGYVTAQARSGAPRIVASAGGLQTKSMALIIARRPDTVTVSGKLRDTLQYVVPDVASTNTTASLALKVVTRDTAGAVTATQGWLVSYQLFHDGAAVAATDTTLASLVGDNGGRSALDTTGTDGVASRKVRVRPLGIRANPDSVVVLATVRYRGAAVRGTPVRFVILLRPK